MPWQYSKHIRRPFQALFYSMEHHYKESRKLYVGVHSQDMSQPRKLDQDLWKREKAASISSFIMGVAAIEAFVNNMLLDFSIRGKNELSVKLLNKSQKSNSIERWPLVDKVYFLPTLCNKHLGPPAAHFNKDSKAFRLFGELVNIRHSIMHGKLEPFIILRDLTAGDHKVFTDDFPDNSWPISKIPKDFTSFNYECAKVAYENITWVRDSLIKEVDSIDSDYMVKERIVSISDVIKDEKLSKSDLLRDWRDYVFSDWLSR